MQRKRNPLTLLVGIETGALWKTIWMFLKKLKREPPYDTAIVLLGIYPNDTKMQLLRWTCTLMFAGSFSTIAKLRKEFKHPSTDGWIKKTRHIHAMEYYSATKNNDILPFARTGMEFTLSKIS